MRLLVTEIEIQLPLQVRADPFTRGVRLGVRPTMHIDIVPEVHLGRSQTTTNNAQQADSGGLYRTGGRI